MKKTLFSVAIIIICCSQLSSLTFSGNTGFAIPVGTWANHHSPAPYLALGIDLYQNKFSTLGLALEMSSFRGKLNSDYHLQIVSPGAAIRLFPLFFLQNRSIFLRETITYSFLQRNLHEASEKGHDFGFLSVLGFEFKMAEHWGITPYFGEKHYLGGIDMFSLGLEVSFRK